ncbi:MAG: alpha/beta hydrolase fold domain-containing protein [Planktomarina sp.]
MNSDGFSWATAHVPDLRDSFAQERAKIAHLSAPDVQVTEYSFCTGQGLVFTPPQVQGDDVLYFHGGGWIVGSPWTHRTLCSWLAHHARARVFAPPYALAPEQPFPQQVLDAKALAAEFGATRGSFTVAGDSAGAAMGLWADAGDKVVSLYGAFGCADTPSYYAFEDGSQGLTGADMDAMYGYLLGDTPRSDFQAALAREGGPMLMVAAGLDPLWGDSDWMEAASRRAVTRINTLDRPHAFLQFCATDAVAMGVMRQIGDWLRAG